MMRVGSGLVCHRSASGALRSGRRRGVGSVVLVGGFAVADARGAVRVWPAGRAFRRIAGGGFRWRRRSTMRRRDGGSRCGQGGDDVRQAGGVAVRSAAGVVCRRGGGRADSLAGGRRGMGNRRLVAYPDSDFASPGSRAAVGLSRAGGREDERSVDWSAASICRFGGCCGAFGGEFSVGGCQCSPGMPARARRPVGNTAGCLSGPGSVMRATGRGGRSRGRW